MDFQLKELRKAAGYKSRKAFSEAIHVAERQVKSWETLETRITLDDACKVADFLKCSLDELAGRWEYVGKYSDERQRRLNEAYMYLDESQKDIAVGSIEGMASVQARKKTADARPEAG